MDDGIMTAEVVDVDGIEYTILNDTHYRTYVSVPDENIYVKAPGIQDGCFYNVSNIKRVICDRTVTYIGEHAFSSSSIQYIKTGSATIQSSAFRNTSSLSQVIISSCESIGDDAFASSSIQAIDLRRVSSIGNTAFPSTLKAYVVTSSQTITPDGAPNAAKIVYDSSDALTVEYASSKVRLTIANQYDVYNTSVSKETESDVMEIPVVEFE